MKTVVITREPVELYKILKFEGLSISGINATHAKVSQGWCRVGLRTPGEVHHGRASTKAARSAGTSDAAAPGTLCPRSWVRLLVLASPSAAAWPLRCRGAYPTQRRQRAESGECSGQQG